MYADPALHHRDPDAVARRLRDLARIRKLLRLADDQDGHPEGRAARARAEELLARHGLTRMTLPTADLGADFRQRSFAVGRASAWRHTLVHTIADYFDCVALHHKGSEDVETWGPEHALPQVEYTFVVYMRHLRTAWREHAEVLEQEGIWQRLSKRQQVDAREAFCVSFTLGVKQRLEQDRVAERQEDSRSHDTSVRLRKELERWMRQGGVRWRASPRSVDRLDGHGYKAGLEAEIEPALKAAGPPRRLGG